MTTTEERLASLLADQQVAKADLQAIHTGLTKRLRAYEVMFGEAPFSRRLREDIKWLQRVIDGLAK